ncbi:GPI biosynthesis protein Pig-F [Talaromyces proteolyticus]|uniref:GPI biosynthesis protein Pig-F n=1 Tax=Talaromyces proteolyticus TaxID=1131652 RepID=A0AAD4PY84_9EURO|nr:GPI biosynthesis protein Pig-F [Talaromyces proteolyticus]KAH8694888.1 GPI biosynthesis protein Pig-F [Talaromyces proteolyticus]
MSSPVSTPSIKAPDSPTTKPISSGPPTVDILPTPAAQTYSHVHPALLLALYGVRFPALVADPVSTLLTDLPVYTALQVAYAVTCLPQAGTHNAHPANPTTEASPSTPGTSGVVKSGKTGYRKKIGHGGSKGDGVFKRLTASFLSLTLTFLLGTPVLALLLVLFGAPFTTHNAHTILAAAHMALLAVTPLVYVHGVDGVVWMQVWAFSRPADAVWGGALGTGVGAWLGAVPIPLDWDRPWQAYPITVLTGAYLGYAVGQLIARTPLLYGKRIQFNKPSE